MLNQGCASGFHSHNILINGHWFILGTTFVELERKQPLPILYMSPSILISWSITCLRIQIPSSVSQLLCPGEILLMVKRLSQVQEEPLSPCDLLLIQRSVWAVFSTCGNSITW
ncbi:hypothetical protein NC651_021281 [Populus alba x Populus x berolinensis]|nr:hypothetical protein NC651_021281 [Populus alba x Populus x berolinensis]